MGEWSGRGRYIKEVFIGWVGRGRALPKRNITKITVSGLIRPETGTHTYISNTCHLVTVINEIGAELVRIQRLLRSELAFLFRGHTKIDVDRIFAIITAIIKKEDCFNLL